jgi:hypothetical protein
VDLESHYLLFPVLVTAAAMVTMFLETAMPLSALSAEGRPFDIGISSIRNARPCDARRGRELSRLPHAPEWTAPPTCSCAATKRPKRTRRELIRPRGCTALHWASEKHATTCGTCFIRLKKERRNALLPSASRACWCRIARRRVVKFARRSSDKDNQTRAADRVTVR